MGKTSRSWVLLAVAAAAAMALSVPAYATVGDSGYLTWDSMGGANGTSPHGGYSTTTNKCAVCHSVHNADPNGELLLPAMVADACTYCHVSTTSAYTQVYDSDVNNYSGADNEYGHQTWMVGATTYGVQCTVCHTVHGSTDKMPDNAYLQSKILVGEKEFITEAQNYDSFAQQPLSTDSSDTALTKWCTSCHPTGLGTPYTYYNDGNVFTSHVMTTDTASYTFPNGTTGQIAWIDSGQCASCHASGYTTSDWPHFTDGKRFLVSASDAASASVPATDTSQDGICLRCHRNGTGSGIGLDF